MAIKPILFNTEMVRAILDGRKTCTRRVVKTRRKDACGFYVTKRQDGSFTGVYEYDEDERMFENQLIQYKLGDILYVRETWCGLPVNEAGHFRGHPIYYYRADGDLRPEGWRGAWHPSIHMPKEAARIWLKVTDVRVERLQDITEDGAKAEGANWKNGKNVGWEEKMRHTAIERFAEIWESTVKKSDLDRYGWAANPWVWVIDFERCEKPEEKRR
jgi:hypothetical protein